VKNCSYSAAFSTDGDSTKMYLIGEMVDMIGRVPSSNEEEAAQLTVISSDKTSNRCSRRMHNTYIDTVHSLRDSRRY
jgi:hypothetical protein